MGLRPFKIFYFSAGTVFIRQNLTSNFQCGDRFYTSESDVYRRQILTYKDGPRTEGVKVTSDDISYGVNSK